MNASIKANLWAALAGTVVGTMAWSFGLARTIWPAHPFWTTLLLTAIAGELTRHVFLREYAARR
jgi:hypothetical protein